MAVVLFPVRVFVTPVGLRTAVAFFAVCLLRGCLRRGCLIRWLSRARRRHCRAGGLARCLPAGVFLAGVFLAGVFLAGVFAAGVFAAGVFAAGVFVAVGVFSAGAALAGAGSVACDFLVEDVVPAGDLLAEDVGVSVGSLRAVDGPGAGTVRFEAGTRVAFAPSSTARLARFRIAARRCPVARRASCRAAAFDAAAFLAAADAFLVGCRRLRARTVVSSSSSTASSRHWASTSRSLDSVPVCGQSEEDLAVVGGDTDRQQVAGSQGQHRIAGDQSLAGRVQRHLRSGHVRDQHVVLAPEHLVGDPHAQRVQGGRRKAGDVGEGACVDRSPGVLVRLGRVRHLVQAHQRVLLPDRKRLQVRCDLAAQGRGLTVVLGHTHRYQSGQLTTVRDGLAPRQQPGPQRPGDHGEDRRR